MNLPSLISRRATVLVFAVLAFFALSAAAANRAHAQVENPGIITGRVLNKATNKYLAAAEVRVAGTNWTALTDGDGWFRLAGIKAGAYTLTASYQNLDSATASVTVVAGETVEVNFELKSDVYQLEKFTVSGEREGQALALQEQRMATASKYSIAADSFGYLQDNNVGELLKQLPGITTFDADDPLGEPETINIRGINDAAAMITTDGNPAVSSNAEGNMTRDFTLKGFNMDNIESVEIFKAPTPSQPGNSLGGIVNFKTKSGFQQKGRQMILGARVNFIDTQVGLGARQGAGAEPNRQFFPEITLGYKEAFFQHTRHPIGIALSLGVSKSGRYGARTTGNQRKSPVLPYGQPDDPNANILATGAGWRDDNAIRESMRAGLKIDQMISANSQYFINFSWNRERQTDGGTRNFTATTAALGPLSTRYVIDMIETKDNRLNLSNSTFKYDTDTWSISPGLKHKWGEFELEYSGYYGKSETQRNEYSASYQLNPSSNDASHRVSFLITEVGADEGAKVQQLTGPDMSTLDNWGNLTLRNRRSGDEDTKYGGKIDAIQNFLFRWPVKLQIGAAYNVTERDVTNTPQDYQLTGKDALFSTPDDPSLGQFIDFNRGGNFYFSDKLPPVPWINPMAVWDYYLQNKDLFFEPASNFSNRLINKKSFKEEVVAGYFQGTITMGPLTLLGGARWERTEGTATGVYTDLVYGSPDSVTYIPGLVERETGRRWGVVGRQVYDNWFPSFHVKYEPLRNLIFRGSITRVIGRPTLTNLLPADQYDPYSSIPRLVRTNPELLPQDSVNINLDVEYYIKNGVVGASYFRYDASNAVETIEYIIGSGIDNGFNGAYEGVTFTTKQNVGFVITQGVEFMFQQNLRYLPWLLKNLSVKLNYTHMEKERDRYGDGRWNEMRENFCPDMANFFLNYNGRKLQWQIRTNWMAEYDTVYQYWNGINVLKDRRYREARLRVDLSLSYKIAGRWVFSTNWSNITREKTVERFNSGLLYTSDFPFTNISFAIKGNF